MRRHMKSHPRTTQRPALRNRERAPRQVEHAAGHLETQTGTLWSRRSKAGTVVVDGDDRAAVGCAVDLYTNPASRASRRASVGDDVGECALDGNAIDIHVPSKRPTIDGRWKYDANAVDNAGGHLFERLASILGVYGVFEDASDSSGFLTDVPEPAASLGTGTRILLRCQRTRHDHCHGLTHVVPEECELLR